MRSMIYLESLHYNFKEIDMFEQRHISSNTSYGSLIRWLNFSPLNLKKGYRVNGVKIYCPLGENTQVYSQSIVRVFQEFSDDLKRKNVGQVGRQQSFVQTA